MKYMGSKARIAKHLLPIILKDRKPWQWYVEPFVGGANMIDKVDGNRIGADVNEHLISALVNIRDNLDIIPKSNQEFTEQDYRNRAKDHIKIKGFAAFAYSYSGKFWGGWRRDKGNRRDYVAESYRNALKQNPLLQGVKLIHSSYSDLEIPDNSIIYCDPPYENTTGYRGKFNHTEFWQWCRDKAKEGHQVFISEYNAPDDFVCLWSKEINSSLTKDTGSKKGVEKLFTVPGNPSGAA